MACLIPEYDELLELLGYNYNSTMLASSLSFKNAISSFIQRFVSPDGTRGSDLKSWVVHRDIFEEMAKSFLDEQHHGRIFWPDDYTDPFFNRLKYTTDYHQIHSIMSQLFYRYNTSIHMDVSHRMPSVSKPGSQVVEPLPSPKPMEECDSYKRIKVRYSVFYEDDRRLNFVEWHPESGVLPQSLQELLSRIPGGTSAIGGKFVLTGPGFQVTRSVFDDEDLARVANEFDEWAIIHVTDFENDVSMEDKTLTVDIHLAEFMPTTAWIFSKK
ncbi:hypothetical protein HDV57DRAFT_488128 [Trichoderma longibrachiatum]